LPFQATKMLGRLRSPSIYTNENVFFCTFDSRRWSRPTSLFLKSTIGNINDITTRNFSRRPKDYLDDPVEELLEENESKALRENEGSVAAWDMEFFGDDGLTKSTSSSSYDNDDDDDDEEERAAMRNKEYREKQEEIQRELDNRTGRPWKDPWAITEEQWMSNITYADLPDWSPKLVSRISQERVQVYPGRFDC
jgi:hypothetical protein